jgi:hypothetical protein
LDFGCGFGLLNPKSKLNQKIQKTKKPHPKPNHKIQKIKKQIQNQSRFCRSKVELVLSYGSQFSEFIFIFSGSEF